MKTICIMTALLIATPALAVTPDQVKACDMQLRAKNKADNAAAPEGFKPKRDRDFRSKFIAECLSK